jgi:hypothetical protein
MSEVEALDLAIVIDTTGSMGGLIQAAQRRLVALIDELATSAEVKMRVGVVEYRDHPPQDTLVYRVHPLEGDRRRVETTINNLRAEGGGDAPEAVLDGVLAACRELDWRPHARRLGILVGDAPPHGMSGRWDAFPDGCPCGETIAGVSRAAEEARLTLYALGLTAEVAEPFTALSRLTGGDFFPAGRGEEAVARLVAILQSEFGEIELDRRVLTAQFDRPDLGVAELAEIVAEGRHAVARSLVRLASRGLTAAPSGAAVGVGR